MPPMVALLKGINVGGHRKVPMADLREVARSLGLASVDTFIQSGNLLFTTDREPTDARDALESAIGARFGFAVDVTVRTADAWHRALETCPFPEDARDRPNLLHLCLCRQPPRDDVEVALARVASPNERVRRQGDDLWILWGDGVARSRLTAAVLDRAAGCPVTARNWNTAHQIGSRLPTGA